MYTFKWLWVLIRGEMSIGKYTEYLKKKVKTLQKSSWYLLSTILAIPIAAMNFVNKHMHSNKVEATFRQAQI